MTEDEIQADLKRNIPPPLPPITPKDPPVSIEEQSSLMHDSLNELHLLKLANFLDVGFQQEADKLKFIYEQAQALAGKTDYDSILLSVNDMLVKLGLKFEPDRFMKLWLWLRLNQEKTAIETQMEKI